MFNSVGKFLQESSTVASAVNAATAATQAVSQSTAAVLPNGPEAVYCTNANTNIDDHKDCKKDISMATLYGNKTSSNKCRMCCNLFCSVCACKSSFKVPGHLLAAQYQPPEGQTNDWTYQHLCAECTRTSQKEAKDIFRKEMIDTYGPNVDLYINASATISTDPSSRSQFPLNFFSMPADVGDSTERQAMRALIIADKVKDVVGLGTAVQLIKYMGAGKKFLEVVVGSDALTLLKPLTDALALYGVTGPTALMRCYYLSCKHNLTNNLLSSHAIEDTVRGTFDTATALSTGMGASTVADLVVEVGMEAAATACRKEFVGPCPPSLLQYMSDYASIAQWLYLCDIPYPRNDNHWSSWYLSRLIRQQGWTLLMCINETRKLPSGRKVPAFCVVARTVTSATSSTGLKSEAMVVVRGSKSTMDWAINFEETTLPLAFHCASGRVVTGETHKGIYEGAMGILDDYGVRTCVQKLLDKGYSVKAVGHSLGAGTAALVAADLRSSLNQQCQGAGAGDVAAVVFACPAIVTENLADVFVEEGLLVNQVTGNDIVPRANRRAIAGLAKQLVDEDFARESDQWYAQDSADLKQYFYTLGKMSKLDRSQNSTTDVAPAEASEEPILTSTDGESTDAIRDPGSFAVLASPGPIIHFYSNNAEGYSAALITHRHPVMNQIQLLLNTAEKVHSMKSVVEAIQQIRQHAAMLPLQGLSVNEEDQCGRFNDLAGLGLSMPLRRAVADAASSWDERSKTRPPYCRQSVLADDSGMSFRPASAASTGAPRKPVKPAKPTKPAPTDTSVVPATSAPSKWTPCFVCNLHCTWPFITHSDASRGSVTQRCGQCGKVVCVICSPSGDKVPGDGVNQEITLRDLRVPLPARGLYLPQRVCLPCYLVHNDF